MNVSSIVVKTLREHEQSVIENLRSTDFCEVHFHDTNGRIVVTIEGEDISEEMRKLKLIQGMPHVLSANLAYAYSEQELALAREHIIMIKDAVPDTLKE
jgi:periplasmic nitrate reductase NapD